MRVRRRRPLNRLPNQTEKKAEELCGSRLIFGLCAESRIPFVELPSEFFI